MKKSMKESNVYEERRYAFTTKIKPEERAESKNSRD
jgi:hypothetical protein